MNASFSHTSNTTLPPRLLPVLQKLKEAYLLWFGYYKELPKVHRHSVGQRIDDLFVISIEMISQASFLSGKTKLPYIEAAIRKIDTLKILLMVLWETKSLDNKKYITLSEKIDEVGRMLGGWRGQIQKKNSSE